LINQRGQALSREDLLANVWADPEVHRTAQWWMSMLPAYGRKLEAGPQSPRHLLTVRGEGYKFVR